MENIVIPTRTGQVCKTLVPLENERDDDVYIITDESSFSDAEIVEAVSLKNLQRNISNPSKAEKKFIPVGNLTVVGEDLTEYIASWNKA